MTKANEMHCFNFSHSHSQVLLSHMHAAVLFIQHYAYTVINVSLNRTHDDNNFEFAAIGGSKMLSGKQPTLKLLCDVGEVSRSMQLVTFIFSRASRRELCNCALIKACFIFARNNYRLLSTMPAFEPRVSECVASTNNKKKPESF